MYRITNTYIICTYNAAHLPAHAYRETDGSGSGSGSETDTAQTYTDLQTGTQADGPKLTC